MQGSSSRLLRDYGITILVAVTLALLIRSYGLEAYRIPSSAMKPTLIPGELSLYPSGHLRSQ